MAEDEKAGSWERFVRHRRQLSSYVRSLIASRDDAADLLQELGVVVLAHDEAPTDPAAFLTWCRGIAHNLALHHWRAKRRYNDVFAAWDAEEERSQPTVASAEQAIVDREALEACVEDLDEPTRELLRLRYVQGKTSRELARMFRQSPEAVRMKIMRVRALLRRRLRDPIAAEADKPPLPDVNASVAQRRRFARRATPALARPRRR